MSVTTVLFSVVSNMVFIWFLFINATIDGNLSPELTMMSKKYSKHQILPVDSSCQGHSKIKQAPSQQSGAKLNFVIRALWSKYSCAPQWCAW